MVKTPKVKKTKSTTSGTSSVTTISSDGTINAKTPKKEEIKADLIIDSNEKTYHEIKPEGDSFTVLIGNAAIIGEPIRLRKMKECSVIVKFASKSKDYEMPLLKDCKFVDFTPHVTTWSIDAKSAN